jgi:histidinol phosphatase-like PHP family hydrolase
MLFDFHTHTFLSDGGLLPIELIRRAVDRGYTAIGVTDHASYSTLDSVIAAVAADCKLAEKYWDIRALPGIEITHVPPEAIADIAREARWRGAQIIVCHGETPVEPVPPGTDLAALSCPDVDVLAHPGPITLELAQLAARNGVYLELSARRGHSLANGCVAAAGRQAGASLLVNSDTHGPDDLLTEDFARRVAAGAGLSPEEMQTALITNPQRLLARIAARP